MELESIINIFNERESYRAKNLAERIPEIRNKVIILNNNLSTSFLVLDNTGRRIFLPIDDKRYYIFWKELQSRPLFLSRMINELKQNEKKIERVKEKDDPLSVAFSVIIENYNKFYKELSAKLLLLGQKIEEVEIYYKNKEETIYPDENVSLISYYRDNVYHIPVDEKIIF